MPETTTVSTTIYLSVTVVNYHTQSWQSEYISFVFNDSFTDSFWMTQRCLIHIFFQRM